ncbi:hypothetical protein ACH5RR_014393 [Cinchona calisaya]|uniref:HAT C-terminal dimerisation domain-containing protein n=1 Tax=Cinchona calisaya TaxID=153742 RepID=A0ABD3A2S3_9GENT
MPMVKTVDIKQTLIDAKDGSLKSPKIDQEKFRESLIFAIVKHDLPFSFVEYNWIREVFEYLNADIKNITRNTAKMDVLKFYANEARKEFDNFESEEYVTSAQKSQLELYLDEPKIDRNTQPDLDILQYWKAQQFRYPDLSKMAFDILAIPITTVASEPAFSIRGRVLDQYCSSLKPEVVEALICTRDWIFGNEGGFKSF